mgnify:FL=1
MNKKLIMSALVISSCNASATSTAKMCAEAGFTYSWQESRNSSINLVKSKNKGWEITGSEAQRIVCLADFYIKDQKFVPTVKELSSGLTYYKKKEQVIAGYDKEANVIKNQINELDHKISNLLNENKLITKYLNANKPKYVNVLIKGRHKNGMVYGFINSSYGFLTGDHGVTKAGSYNVVIKKTDQTMSRKQSNGFDSTVPVYIIDNTSLAIWNKKIETNEYKKSIVNGTITINR